MDAAQLVRPLEPKADDHMPGRHGKRSAQACGMEARRAETQARCTTAHPQRGTPQRQVDKREAKTILRGFSLGMTDDDDTVYCDIQMPLAQGRELLLLVTTLRESNAHPRFTGS